jgi:ribulose-5-phosphate 4-epimerase/fuculose-1-phosphate aldolase
MGRTLEEAVYRAYFFERAAQLQLLTMSVRPFVPSFPTATAATKFLKQLVIGEFRMVQ